MSFYWKITRLAQLVLLHSQKWIWQLMIIIRIGILITLLVMRVPRNDFCYWTLCFSRIVWTYMFLNFRYFDVISLYWTLIILLGSICVFLFEAINKFCYLSILFPYIDFFFMYTLFFFLLRMNIGNNVKWIYVPCR